MKTVIELNNEKFICKRLTHGEGTNSICYLLNNDKVLKIYHNNLSDYNVVYEENLIPLINIESETFAFPEKIFSNDEGIVTGYIYPYIKGETLTYSDKSPFIFDFIQKLDLVYDDILSISNKGIFTCEMGPKNIIFNDKFNIIDTDTYFIIKSIPKEVCLSHNIAIFNQSILDYIIRKEKIDQNLFTYINNNEFLRILWEQMTSKDNAKPLLKEFIYELKRNLEDMYNYNIETFDDLHKVFRKVRK